ncbi:MAG: alpha/beta hydrolase [Candidatus Omnitrophota bacterium]
MPYINTKSQIDWYYKTQGQKEAILFLHGWSFDSSVWFRQLVNFHNYRIIALDMPGHGKSGYQENIDIVEDLNFIISKLKIQKINLVGHSLGGLFSLKFALRYPKVIKKLILISTTAKFANSHDFNFGLEKDEINKLRSFLNDDYPNILLVFIRWLFTNNERSQNDFRKSWNALTDKIAWPRKEAMDEFLSIIEKEDIRASLKDLDVPTLIISGTKDPICPMESTNYLGKQINNSRVELFKDCGHLPFLTQPQRFNSLVKEFLG